MPRALEFWGAHATRVPAKATSPSRTFFATVVAETLNMKVRFGESPKPARESRALPGSAASASAFTVVELLIVMSIILVLAGLILATSGYVQKKGARSRAEAEIAAISAACESYKADNGIYPTSTDTNNLKANSMGDPTQSIYQLASLTLYERISGDVNNNTNRKADEKSYFTFKPNQLSPTDQSQKVSAIRDPFGNSYGYSTVKSSAPSGADGYNPTFDLWSTGGLTSGTDQPQWIKNW